MAIRASYRDIWRIAFPVIMAGVNETIIEVTDTIFLGRVGVVELGAIAVADSLYLALLVFSVGLSNGIQIIIARRAGEGDRKAIGRVFNQSIYLVGIVAVALFAVLRFLSPYLIGALVSSDDVSAAVNGFLRFMAFGIIFASLNAAYNALYIGISRTRALMWATIVLAVTNIVLDYGLIFGRLGLPEMGMEGAALASVIAEISAFLFLTVYTVVKLDRRGYGLFAFARWDGVLFSRIVRISTPAILEDLLVTAGWFAFFVIIEQLGEFVLACSNIIYSSYLLLLIPVGGLAETAVTMVSTTIGQGRGDTIPRLAGKITSLGYFIVGTPALFALCFPDCVLSVFTADPEVIEGCTGSLFVIVGAVLVVLPGEIYLGAIAGTGDTTVSFLITMLQTIFILAYVYTAALIATTSLEIIWMVEIHAWLIGLVFAYSWLKAGKWRRIVV